jgi:hypothetical protein
VSNERILREKSSVTGLVDYTTTESNKFEHNKSGNKSMSSDTLHTDLPFPVEERSKVEQIDLECRVTDYLQQQVDHCNRHLKNFQLFLEMDEDNTKPNNGRRYKHNV